MSAMSNYLETALLSHVLDNTAMTSPTTVYVGVFTAAPSDAGGGTEAAWTGYARQSAAFTVSGNVASNSAEITFPAADGAATVTHIGIFDALSAGNLLFHGALTAPKTLDASDVLAFLAGEIDITLD